MILVRKERDAEILLLLELFLPLDGVGADAEKDGVELAKLGGESAELPRLGGSAGRHRPRVREEHNVFALQVSELDTLAILVSERERRRRYTFFESHGVSSLLLVNLMRKVIRNRHTGESRYQTIRIFLGGERLDPGCARRNASLNPLRRDDGNDNDRYLELPYAA